MSSIIYRSLWLSYGLLRPAYLSYKTIKDKKVKEYVRLMMYWIVLALYSFAEVFADFFLSWLPFYWEVKISLLLWITIPATKGTTILYTNFIHPLFLNREREIDEFLDRVRGYCYDVLVFLGAKGFNVVTNLLSVGHRQLSSHLMSLSLSELNFDDVVHDDQRFVREFVRDRAMIKRGLLMKSHTIADPTPHRRDEKSNEACDQESMSASRVSVGHYCDAMESMLAEPVTSYPEIIQSPQVDEMDYQVDSDQLPDEKNNNESEISETSSLITECSLTPPDTSADEITEKSATDCETCHSESGAMPIFCHDQSQITSTKSSKHKTRSSVFTKSNFLRSLIFFDKTSNILKMSANSEKERKPE